MNILIADDEKPAREELSFLLQGLLPEASLTTAKDGDDALSLLRESDFDVVFLDIEMPGKDGLQVATKILERPSPPRIVFATAYSEHAVEAFRLSALDYLVKPVRQDRLEQTSHVKLPLHETNELERQYKSVVENPEIESLHQGMTLHYFE